MDTSKSGKANPMLGLGLVIIALVGFIVAAYYSTLQEFDTMRAQIADIRSQNKKDIDSLSDQIRQRYLTVLKQAQDIDQQQGKLQAIDRAITAEKEALGTIEDSFHTELQQMKKAGLDSTREVVGLEDRFNQEVKVKELKLAKLQDDYLGMKNEVEDQQTLLVMMREQSLLDKYKQPQDGRTTVEPAPNSTTGDSTTPAPDPTMAPATSTSTPSTTPYVTPAPTTLVPTNNRVVTDLPSPSSGVSTPAPDAPKP